MTGSTACSGYFVHQGTAPCMSWSHGVLPFFWGWARGGRGRTRPRLPRWTVSTVSGVERGYLSPTSAISPGQRVLAIDGIQAPPTGPGRRACGQVTTSSASSLLLGSEPGTDTSDMVSSMSNAAGRPRPSPYQITSWMLPTSVRKRRAMASTPSRRPRTRTRSPAADRGLIRSARRPRAAVDASMSAPTADAFLGSPVARRCRARFAGGRGWRHR